jgi:hypothetical protein
MIRHINDYYIVITQGRTYLELLIGAGWKSRFSNSIARDNHFSDH